MKKLCLFLLCISCAPHIHTFGFENLEYESQNAIEKKDDKSSILNKFGLPNSLSLDKNTWYYVYFEKEVIAFFPVKIKDDTLLKLIFDQNGKLIQKTLIHGFLKKQKMLPDTTTIERSKKNDNYIAEILENIAGTQSNQDAL